RATLDQQRRRETELAALVDTARDLAVLRDLDAVLVAIVRRARTLLGTDTAYLTLVDDATGDTHMRVTDGSVSATFQRLRLPRGAGLGGLVAITGAPYATADYLHDERFRHTPEIDTSVLDEGLVAILGVPLALGHRASSYSTQDYSIQGSRVIGVLFAANRRHRPFAREEVDLLGSLGALAAVAIDNARLLAETQQAIAEVRAANELVRQHSTQVERAADAHERMTALVLRGGDVPDLASAVVEVLAGSLLVLDAERRELASVGKAAHAASGLDLDGLADVLATARRSAGCVGVAESPLGPCTVAAVLAGGDPLGYLVLHGRQPLAGTLDGGERRILERAAQITALLLLLRRARSEAENRLRGELLTDLLAAPERDGLRERALRLPLDLDTDHVVVTASADAVGRHRLASAAAVLASDRHGLAGEYQGVVVLLVPALDGTDTGDAAVLVRNRLAAAVRAKVTAGAAGPARGPAGLAEAYRQARRCLDALHALGRLGEAACPADLGFAGLLLAQADGAAVGRFVADTIGPILSYDARRGTELTATLQSYFAHDRSPARCAVPLHVHVNTVTQRLDRIRQLLGDEWQHPDRALQVQLALHLHRLRG
ncbi:MAG TPA: helix-turn-helix domain-containing protein, partial [Pseudonocardiaceae bacterium]